MPQTKAELLGKMQQDIRRLEGFKPDNAGRLVHFGIHEIDRHLPHGALQTSCIHEVIGDGWGQKAAATSFLSAILANLVGSKGIVVWVIQGNNLYGPGLQHYGLDASQIIFINVYRPKDALWAILEALRCKGIGAVVGEVENPDFAITRRLQLAVETSGVTGFLLHSKKQLQQTTATTTRWLIEPHESHFDFKHAGLGYPAWSVELLKAKGGKPGKWQVCWKDGGFVLIRNADKSLHFSDNLLEA